MKDKIVKIARTIFFLPPIPTLTIAIPSFAAVTAALAGWVELPALEYAAYLMSAYAMVISVTGISKIVSLVRNGIREHPLTKLLLSVPVIDKLVSERGYRTEMALYPESCINVLYAVFKTSMGIYDRSVWFISLGAYYMALAIMRSMLIHYIRSRKQTADKADELRRYRMCGCMLLLADAPLAGITILAVQKNNGFVYPGYLVYVMAMYAFYSVITAAVNIVKYRRYGSPVLSAAKVINMSAALVSIFSLETAMLEQFENTEQFRKTMTALTGAGVSIIVVGMAVFMIVRSCILIKRDI